MNGTTGLQHFALALCLEFDRALHVLETVQVLYFGTCAEGVAAFRADADVRIATQTSFFHIAVAYIQVTNQASHLHQVIVRFLRTTDIGLAHDLYQGNSCTVQIHKRVEGVHVVDAFASIFFQMDAGDVDVDLRHAERSRGVDPDLSTGTNWRGILRDLVAFGKVRVEIVLAGIVHARSDRAFAGKA